MLANWESRCYGEGRGKHCNEEGDELHDEGCVLILVVDGVGATNWMSSQS